MRNDKYWYIVDQKYFEDPPGGILKNPIHVLDHKIDDVYPELYRVHYGLRLLITDIPDDIERNSLFYNDSIEKYANTDISVLKTAIESTPHKSIFLNGFSQKHLEYIIPFIKDSVEILYLFKCPKISDFSVLSELKNLKVLFVFWNNSLERLWDVTENGELKIISFVQITKLCDITGLKNSDIEYITLDSSDASGNTKPMLFDKSVFEEMPKLKHLTLNYRKCIVYY